MSLDSQELKRYSRHIILPEVGLLGQLKLKSAKVLLIGAGGLGSPISLYLAAAGVGTIGIVEFDQIDLSNLQRQILFYSHEVGQSKAIMAKTRLLELNPSIAIHVFEQRLSVNNARTLISQFDLVIDGSDNFETRYLVNDACVFEKKPLVYGSIYKFEGQATFFDVKVGPCYRCLFPEPPPEGLAPNCAEAGVIGVLPGIIGTIQANEAIKWILGIGDLLLGRLLIFDALKMRFREFGIQKNPDCPICGVNPTIKDLRSETFSCELPDIEEISPKEFSKWRDAKKPFFLLDVRELKEYELSNLGGYLIPLADLANRLHELNKEIDIIVHCASGVRSLKACLQLKEAGFNKVWNLKGGMADIKPT